MLKYNLWPRFLKMQVPKPDSLKISWVTPLLESNNPIDLSIFLSRLVSIGVRSFLDFRKGVDSAL